MVIQGTIRGSLFKTGKADMSDITYGYYQQYDEAVTVGMTNTSFKVIIYVYQINLRKVPEVARILLL